MQDGQRGMGNPRTDAQRRARHKDLYGNDNLPPRGTGLGLRMNKEQLRRRVRGKK